jgi:serine/threonine-protein kinase
VQLLLPIADALSAAHAKGFVHRDVKPDNVFVVVSDEQLQPKLVDFGIVKLEQRDKNSKLTQVGTVLGSPDYMSPEQARGLETIDLRSDVWSFSVMLYEAIAGQTPFSSTNYNALLRMIVEDEAPALRSLRAADAALSAIVAQGMSKDPAQRHQSMNRLGRALAEWLISQGATEDVCGVSLDAKWLSRTTDPQARAAARASRPNPDSWPDPPSGVRAMPDMTSGRSEAANAPTVVASDAGTPVSVSPFTRTIPPGGRKLYLGVAGAVVALAGLLLWLGLSSNSSPQAPNSAATAVEPALATPEPKAMPELAPTPPQVPPPIPVEALPSAQVEPAPKPASAKAASRTRARGVAEAPPDAPKAAPVPAKPAGPSSDLMSPY